MQDFLLQSDNFDLTIEHGDFVINNSDNQHKALLLMLDKGSLKENTTVGTGTFKQLESDDPAAFLREVRRQFTGDGLDINKIYFDSQDKFIVDANYI